mgnify:CR=1 FL=1
MRYDTGCKHFSTFVFRVAPLAYLYNQVVTSQVGPTSRTTVSINHHDLSRKKNAEKSNLDRSRF